MYSIGNIEIRKIYAQQIQLWASGNEQMEVTEMENRQVTNRLEETCWEEPAATVQI